MVRSPVQLEVQISDGKLRGKMASERVRVFKGVPFAQPPVGDLRWRPPVAAEPWAGTRDATAFGYDCPQATEVGSRAPGQSEDCLFLNVWAPADAEPGSLPVLVWFHGGSFLYGSGSECRLDGTRLANEGAIVVTFNYRVGIFGFFAHPDLTKESTTGSSSNYGLMDQVLALQWIRANIARFGGDPQNVTAFGVSAGSAAIALLLTSPSAQGLFDKAILQSPGAGRRLASLSEAEAAGVEVDDLVTLRGLSSQELLDRTHLLAPKVRGLTVPRVLRPIRDGWLIPRDEPDAYEQGHLHAMPLILGTNLDEGSEATENWPIKSLEQYSEFLRSSFGDHAEQAFDLYPAATEAEVKLRVAELFGDTQFNFGTRLLAKKMAERNPQTWRYLFTHRRAHRSDGPHHGQEVHYVFGNLLAPYPGEQALSDERDEALSKAMMRAWVSFAETGDPNGEHTPYWDAYRVNDDNYLKLASPMVAKAGWRKEQLDFLETYFERVRKSESR